ncbi:hypothetical protein NAL32_13670 [Chryseobacterium sp. Ch-15]|uniref:Uncharacterized protein n=1 Tax=Chryseobacterium muglaense TaxID=2893752 RepID=A0A9Q3V040_9FLAO|nr:hypothetical protein [Chryseobacterium muglaense]MBD3905417.1 hypothetical protein [Chryseobacterium muglaense]MCC9036509.1 hypothetical protein [Chryseobacterium muglaense]MCM2555434.1 hypothetical protein [Chryseobacterium muglaense]
MTAGVNFCTPTVIERNCIEPTQVKSIKLLTELDDGSANDNSGTIKPKSGIVLGKTYTFQVETYTNEDPKDKSLIKWAVSYTDPETGAYHKNVLEEFVTGDSIRITFTNQNMCGYNLEVKAYINDLENEGKLPLFQHNRFRFFDSIKVEDELKIRTDAKQPWKINQSGTSLCGMACIFYLFAKEQPDAYTQFSKKLFRTGEATYNQYTVKPTEELLEKPIDTNGFPINTGSMPLIDFVTMAGTRNADNNSYKGGNEEFQAINWPPLMTKLCGELLGYADVASDGVYNPIKKSRDYHKPTVWKMIEDINQQISNGYKMILMIDSDLISEDEDTIWNMLEFEYHWVVLEGPIRTIQNLNGKGEIFYTLDFKVYSWGSNNTYLKKEITLDHFINN